MIFNVPFKKLQHVVHIADVHIRLFRRHDEYEQAFNTLYADIKSKNLSDFVIVLAGDIVHAKTDMSPEMVRVASKFLSNIADIAPTIMIAGNHDCNLANEHRLDSLTPIVENLNHPNLLYQKKSGIITIADTDFSVCSIFDDQEDWPSATECKSKNKIALYHGPVHGALTDANFVITNRHVHVSNFDGYDIVMLGDIHRHQVLQERNVEDNEPIVVYASSLIQQNHGETLGNHGWCLWNIPSRTFEFVELVNDYGYVTLEVINGQLQAPASMPKNVRARLFTESLDNTQVKKLISVLKTKYNILELSVNKSRTARTIDRSGKITSNHLMNLSDVSTQNELIKDWLKRNEPNLDDKVIASISRLNENLNHIIAHEDFSRNISWKPLKFKFSNMFSYGEDNEINFEDMRGLYGIFAANASGKSSMMDSLMFCLYDKTPRAFKGDHIINNRKDVFECELTFDINGETFGIKRTGTRKKTGDVKVDVDFWKVSDTGDKVSLNGEDRRDTNANIRSYVGTYEDFIMTTYSGQSANSLFIDKSHSERKDLLIQFMGLNVFDKLYDAANTDMKEISGVLKRFKKSSVTDELTTIRASILEETGILASTEIKSAKCNSDIEELEKDLAETLERKLPIQRVPSKTIHQLEDELSKTLNKIVISQTDQAKLENEISILVEDILTITEEQSAFYPDELLKDIATHDAAKVELNKLEYLLSMISAKIVEKEAFKQKLKEYKYNPDCSVCMENYSTIAIDVMSTTADLSELYKQREDISDQMVELTKTLNMLKVSVSKFEEFNILEKRLIQAENKLSLLNANLQLLSNSIEKLNSVKQTLEQDIEIYKTNSDTIEFNYNLDQIAAEIRGEIKKKNTEKTSLQKEIVDINGNIKVFEAKKQDLMNKLKEAEELEENYNAYLHYMSAIGRDGIPYEIITKTIPNIQSEINSLLSQIVDFVVTLEVDGKNINAKLTYDFDRVWPLENSSGMERFVTSLAIRVALMNASNLPKPNFLMIDEGFGTLDTEHLQSMQTLFNLLKNHFDFIFIVSHLDSARDMVDTLIEIKKEDGYSQISI